MRLKLALAPAQAHDSHGPYHDDHDDDTADDLSLTFLTAQKQVQEQEEEPRAKPPPPRDGPTPRGSRGRSSAATVLPTPSPRRTRARTAALAAPPTPGPALAPGPDEPEHQADDEAKASGKGKRQSKAKSKAKRKPKNRTSGLPAASITSAAGGSELELERERVLERELELEREDEPDPEDELERALEREFALELAQNTEPESEPEPESASASEAEAEAQSEREVELESEMKPRRKPDRFRLLGSLALIPAAERAALRPKRARAKGGRGAGAGAEGGAVAPSADTSTGTGTGVVRLTLKMKMRAESMVDEMASLRTRDASPSPTRLSSSEIIGRSQSRSPARLRSHSRDGGAASRYRSRSRTLRPSLPPPPRLKLKLALRPDLVRREINLLLDPSLPFKPSDAEVLTSQGAFDGVLLLESWELRVNGVVRRELCLPEGKDTRSAVQHLWLETALPGTTPRWDGLGRERWSWDRRVGAWEWARDMAGRQIVEKETNDAIGDGDADGAGDTTRQAQDPIAEFSTLSTKFLEPLRRLREWGFDPLSSVTLELKGAEFALLDDGVFDMRSLSRRSYPSVHDTLAEEARAPHVESRLECHRFAVGQGASRGGRGVSKNKAKARSKGKQRASSIASEALDLPYWQLLSPRRKLLDFVKAYLGDTEIHANVFRVIGVGVDVEAAKEMENVVKLVKPGVFDFTRDWVGDASDQDGKDDDEGDSEDKGEDEAEDELMLDKGEASPAADCEGAEPQVIDAPSGEQTLVSRSTAVTADNPSPAPSDWSRLTGAEVNAGLEFPAGKSDGAWDEELVGVTECMDMD